MPKLTFGPPREELYNFNLFLLVYEMPQSDSFAYGNVTLYVKITESRNYKRNESKECLCIIGQDFE
jgi:hypothetical protein